jgi:serine/threonine protein kinase
MTYTMCGTPNYLSPEVILNKGHGFATDHWSLGVLIYEMVVGENPFFYDDMPQMELFEAIVRDKFYPLPDDVSDDAFDVIDGLLIKDPTRRLGALAGRGKDIINREWFRDLDLVECRQKRHEAPFIPHNTELEKTIRRASSNSAAKIGGLAPPISFSSPLMGRSTIANDSLLEDSDEDNSEGKIGGLAPPPFNSLTSNPSPLMGRSTVANDSLLEDSDED